MPPFVVFPTKRIAYFVEVSLYFILSSTTSYIVKKYDGIIEFEYTEMFFQTVIMIEGE